MTRFHEDFPETGAMFKAHGHTEEEITEIRKVEGDRMVLESILEGRKERAEKLAKEKGVALQTAYKMLRGEKWQSPLQEGSSKKDAILEIIYRYNSIGGLSMDSIMEGCKALLVRIDYSDLEGRLWDLQKQGFVKFNETHTAHGSEIRRVRLTPAGRAEAIEKRGGTPRVHEERVNARSLMMHGFSQSPRMGDHKPVGVDGTDFRNHRKVAKGGPIEKIPTATPPLPEPEALGPVTYPPKVEPPPQNQKTADPILSYVGQTPPDPFGVVLSRDYPAIQALFDRRGEKALKREKAAKVVEAASIMADVDASYAEVLLRMASELEGEPFSNLEIEILKFVDRILIREHRS